MVAITGVAVAACLSQTHKQSVVLGSPVDQKTAVSFFWFGDDESHWREPMNFYVAAANDPRLHTVLIRHERTSEGVKTWITASEMQALIGRLAKSSFVWRDSRTVKLFGPWEERTDGRNSLNITVVRANGTAKAKIRLARICDELLAFDSVMPTPRLLWQFQTLRWDDGCIIAGYHNEAMPKQ